jgi:Glycosyl transferase 4-like domain
VARTVLYVHSSAGRYGADRQLLAMAAGLDSERYRAVAVLPEGGPLADDLRTEGVEVIMRPELAVRRRSLYRPAGLARVARRWAADRSALGRLARERGAALVHANTSVCAGASAGAAGARVPLVVSIREIYADFAGGGRSTAASCCAPTRSRARQSPCARSSAGRRGRGLCTRG